MRRASSRVLKAIGGDVNEGPSLIDLEWKQMTRAQLDRLLRPRSIALVGASSTSGSLGECVLNNLEEAGYSGELHLVNPKRPTIHKRTCLGSIEELPAGVDCAVLAIPGPAVVESVRACAARQVGSAIVFSAGFAEAGEAGRSAQGELQSIAREHGMIVAGPNCLGMVNYVDGIPLTFVVTPPQEREGAAGVAIISQSGALAAVIAVNMRHHGIPLTYSVSTGNEAATGVEDFIEHLIGDRTTRVFALVVEQFRQPKRLLDLVRRANEADQFIVLLHPGRSGKARISAATHTGALAGDYEVMHTLVTHAGVIHVESMEELVDVAQILVRCRELPSGGAAVFTESGAFKALALDLCDRVGLELPELSSQAQEALTGALPAFIPPSNPLDLTAQGLVDPDLYRRTLPPVLNEERFGSVLLGIILTDPKTTQLKLPPIVDAIRSLSPRKPMVFAALDEGAPFDFPELRKLREIGVACFPSPERAIRALANVTSFALRRADRDRALLADSVTTCPMEGVLSEWESKSILVQLGVAVPQGRLARSMEEAVLIAAEIGFPVVMKAQSAELPHKSDAGGVILAIESTAELLDGWRMLHSNVKAARPDIVLDGVLVERMSEKGMELIVGGRNDPDWGPVLVVGAGGVLAEAMGDVRLIPADLSGGQIEEQLRKLRCGALFDGFRGSPPLDVAAVAEVAAKVGCLMRSTREIVEIDINPLVVYRRGKGVVALDALISAGRVKEQQIRQKGEEK
jgi:acetate---CoA ligase (ADP-forming)